MKETVVVNIRKEKCDCYIGRGSPFGNMYIIGKHGNRDQVIAKYRAWFLDKVSNDQAFRSKVMALKGKRLGCFCKPLPCHGDVLVQLIEGGES